MHMMKIKVLHPFKFAEDGITVVSYAPGIHTVSEHVAAVAIREGWAKRQGIWKVKK